MHCKLTAPGTTAGCHCPEVSWQVRASALLEDGRRNRLGLLECDKKKVWTVMLLLLSRVWLRRAQATGAGLRPQGSLLRSLRGGLRPPSTWSLCGPGRRAGQAEPAPLARRRWASVRANPTMRSLCGVRGLIVEPGFVAFVEVVVVGESAFETGQRGGPDVQGVGGLLKGQPLGCPCRPECAGVGGGVRVKELVVEFPGDVAFEATHEVGSEQTAKPVPNQTAILTTE